MPMESTSFTRPSMFQKDRHKNTSDLTFICKGGRKAYAHQYVLGIHSPFLKQLFLVQSRIGKIDLTRIRFRKGRD